MVEDGAFSHKIDYVAIIFLHLKSHHWFKSYEVKEFNTQSSFVKISLLCRHALMVEDGAFSALRF